MIVGLIRMIEDKRLKVRVYTKGRFHAKAYICDYGKVFDPTGKEVARHEKGIAVVGSSILTLAGLTHNTELNVIVQGNQNHQELVRWFDDLWKEAQEFDETLMLELRSSWAAAQVRPYDIYRQHQHSGKGVQRRPDRSGEARAEPIAAKHLPESLRNE